MDHACLAATPLGSRVLADPGAECIVFSFRSARVGRLGRRRKGVADPARFDSDTFGLRSGGLSCATWSSAPGCANGCPFLTEPAGHAEPKASFLTHVFGRRESRPVRRTERASCRSASNERSLPSAFGGQGVYSRAIPAELSKRLPPIAQRPSQDAGPRGARTDAPVPPSWSGDDDIASGILCLLWTPRSSNPMRWASAIGDAVEKVHAPFRKGGS